MSTDSPPVASPPGSVQAATILLLVGGGLTALSALAGFFSGSTGTARATVATTLGLLFVALALALRRGRPWARLMVLILCGIGVALAGVSLSGAGVAAAVNALGWPVVYAILLNTDKSRAWFRRPA